MSLFVSKRRMLFLKIFIVGFLLIPLPLTANKPLNVNAPLNTDLGSVMFIGNSFFYYNNSLHNHLGSLIKNDDSVGPLKRRSITINGSALSWHDVEGYLSNQSIGNFRIDSSNDNAYIKSLDTSIDAVIFMDCSLCPIHPDTQENFHSYVAKHSKTIRASNAEPMLFMSWPYKNKPKMIGDLRREFIKAANENDILLIPAGEAFYQFSQDHPEIDLYNSDLRHPSKEGTYLAAAVVFSTLYGKGTSGNLGIMNLDPGIALKIQKSVDVTVQNFLNLTF
jgi:hypothetical protein